MEPIKLFFKINGVDFSKVFDYDSSFMEFVAKVASTYPNKETPKLDTVNDCKRYIRNCVGYSYEMFSREENMYDTVSRALNSGVEIPKVIELHERDHRTLQQKFTGFCLSWIAKAGSSDYGFDGRNEYSHKQCEKIKNFMEEQHISAGMPLI